MSTAAQPGSFGGGGRGGGGIGDGPPVRTAFLDPDGDEPGGEPDDELTRRVLAEPDPDRRAAMLGLSLARVAGTRRRLVASLVLLATAVMLATTAPFLVAGGVLHPVVVVAWYGQAVLGAALAWAVWQIASLAGGLLEAALAGRGRVAGVLAFCATPLAHAGALALGAAATSMPYAAALGTIGGLAFAIVVTWIRALTDYAGLIRGNHPSAARLVTAHRGEAPGSTLLDGMRWQLVDLGGWMLLRVGGLLAIMESVANAPLVFALLVADDVLTGSLRDRRRMRTSAALRLAAALALIGLLVPHLGWLLLGRA